MSRTSVRVRHLSGHSSRRECAALSLSQGGGSVRIRDPAISDGSSEVEYLTGFSDAFRR